MIFFSYFILNKMSKLYTLSQAAKTLNVSNITICNWANEGHIKFIVLPGSERRRYILDSILEEKKSLKMIKLESSTQEFLPQSNGMISIDKLNSSEKNIQTTNSLKILEAGSIIKERDFSPWWTELSMEMSQKSWLPTETDCVDLVSKYSSSSSENMKRNSWFSITRSVPKKKSWSKISFQSSPSFPVGITDLENIKSRLKKTSQSKKPLKKKKVDKKNKRKKKKIEGLQRAKVIQIYYTKEQKLLIRKWFRIVRACYNKVIEMFEKNPSSLPFNKRTEIRNQIIKEIPDEYSVNLEAKRNAIEEAYNAIDNGGNNFGYRSCKDPSESMYVRTGCVSTKKNTLFPTSFPSLNIKKNKLFKPEADGMTKIVRKQNKFFIHMNEVKQSGISYDIFKQRDEFCAIDPGTGTFGTYWSPNLCGKIAPEGGKEIFGLCKRVDRLISKKSTLKKRKRHNISRAITRTRTLIKNKIADLHWKTASFLCNSFDNIFLPPFETKGMSNKKKRKITSKTARMMLTLSHYKFRQRLLSKSQEKAVSVLLLDEPYTSQLCSGCFNLNKKLRLCDRTYNCKNCKIQVDRDFNAARNIFFRGFEILRARGFIPCAMGGSPFLL